MKNNCSKFLSFCFAILVSISAVADPPYNPGCIEFNDETSAIRFSSAWSSAAEEMQSHLSEKLSDENLARILVAGLSSVFHKETSFIDPMTVCLVWADNLAYYYDFYAADSLKLFSSLANKINANIYLADCGHSGGCSHYFIGSHAKDKFAGNYEMCETVDPPYSLEVKILKCGNKSPFNALIIDGFSIGPAYE